MSGAQEILAPASAAAALMSTACDLDPTSAEAWADVICDAWRSSVLGVIRTGRLLMEAKGSIAHGEWARLCDEILPFSGRTAERLMRIAAHERLSDPTHASVLPPSWTTLDALASLDAETFDAAVKADVISPSMERRQAQRLVRGGVEAMLGGQAPASLEEDAGEACDESEECDAPPPETAALEYARSVFAQLFPVELVDAPPLSVEARAVVFAAARGFGVPVEELWRADALKGAARLRAQQARRAAMCLMHTNCGMSQPEVAKPFGLEPSAVSRLSATLEDWRDEEAWSAKLDAIALEAEAAAAFWRRRWDA